MISREGFLGLTMSIDGALLYSFSDSLLGPLRRTAPDAWLLYFTQCGAGKSVDTPIEQYEAISNSHDFGWTSLIICDSEGIKDTTVMSIP
uniref:Uncharacterized protein n=1 Tax=Romanomermis culicivorax TaxID=13658 RepID=A0A915LAT0_ROMCU